MEKASPITHQNQIPLSPRPPRQLQHDIEATLPPYSGPSVPEPSPNVVEHNSCSSKAPPFYPGLPPLDYRLYLPPLFQLSNDSKTLTSRAEYLSTNVQALVSLIRAQASIPPKPQIRIRGSKGTNVEFDIKLNLMSLLVPDDEKQRIDYIRCVGEGELAFRGGVKPDVLPEVSDAGLEEWCRRFVQDTASIKIFTLDRVVANLDTDWIEGQIRSLVASLNFRGVVEVAFVVTHSRVVIQNPDKVNKFFTSVTGLFSGKNKFEVVKAVWPFATTKHGEPGRRCVVQSEEVWWREWKHPIKYAISQKRHGWVTVEDKLEAVMEGKGHDTDTIDWGPDAIS